MIRKNEIQLRFLYGEAVVNALKDGIKDSIKNGKAKIITINDWDKFDEELEAKLKRIK